MNTHDKKSSHVSRRVKGMVFIILAGLSGSVWADYYVVYPEVQVVMPPPVVIYQTKPCCAVKHKKTHPVKHHYSKTIKKKVTSPVITVYYVNTPCCQTGCHSYQTPVAQGCGYKAYSGQPVMHSDYYYMQGINEDAGWYGPDMDGNTADNDIY